MARVFFRKRFSNYLGEERAIDDIVMDFVPDGPGPSPTPSITPSSTPNPLCPLQIVISNAASSTYYVDGTYTRLTTYTGGTFAAAYSDGSAEYVKIGTAPNGKDYATFVYFDGTTYHQYIKRYNSNRWGVIKTTGNTWLNGGTFTGSLYLSPETDLFDGSLYYPTTGLQLPLSTFEYYLSYPVICPSPTPSVTPTMTPTPTPVPLSPTPTPTPTSTETPTPTPSITPTITPSTFFFYEATRCDDLFSPTFIIRSTFAITNNVVSVVGDDTNCYNVGSPVGTQPLWDYDVIAEYIDCPTCESAIFTPIIATGGVETTYTDGSLYYKVHTFLNNGTFDVSSTGSTGEVDYLIVGGGGGGGACALDNRAGGGGGGAGGLLTGTGSVSVFSYPIVIGAGGTGSTTTDSSGTNGGNSSAFGLTAFGGGGGGTALNISGSAGGSGGGCSARTGSAPTGGLGTPGQGYDGGTPFVSGQRPAGAGGGGASEAGKAGVLLDENSFYGGDGGNGLSIDINGTPTYYAGGGGGSQWEDYCEVNPPNDCISGGTGGLGGGGNAVVFTGTTTTMEILIPAQDGQPNTGGGGGGGAKSTETPTLSMDGGDGGSGIVIVRYRIPTPAPSPTPTPTMTLTPTPTSSGFDPDAAAYLSDVLTAGGSLDATISGATDTLFKDLKSNGLYTKLDVLYLMLGETSSSTALNAIRTNSSFDITWNNVGDLTFDYSGVTNTGSGYGNTNYNPSIETSPTDNSIGYYLVGGNIGGGNGEVFPVGSYDGTYLHTQYQNSGAQVIGIYGYDTSRVEAARTFTNWSGSYIGTYDNTPTKSTYKDASGGDSQIVSGSTTGSAGLPNQPHYVMVLNVNGSPYSGQYYNGRVQSVFCGDYLTPSEVNTIDGLINTFHTTLGRNIY